MITKYGVPLIEDELLYESRISGEFLGNFKAPTMRNSRCTGRLAGVEAPAHIKIGSKVLYEGRTLKKWRSQFHERIRSRNAT